nr:hypothetical protein [Tanacetum cinerariifolium]
VIGSSRPFKVGWLNSSIVRRSGTGKSPPPVGDGPSSPFSSEIPPVVNAYLRSSLGDALQKVLQKHTEELVHKHPQQVDYKEMIKESVQANIINEVKNELPMFLPKAVSDFATLGPLGRLTIAAEYFFSNALEFLKLSDPEKKYTTSITKTKAARYEIVGIKNMVPMLWSATNVGYNKDAKKGIKHWGEKCHLCKEIYTPSFDPAGVVYKDLNKQTRVMRADELYTFSDETLKLVRDELHHRALNFFLGYNKEMSRRKWSAIDRRRFELMVKLINKQMRKRWIIRNLKRLVGARELEMDYRLMTLNEALVTKSFHDTVSVAIVTKPLHDTVSEVVVTKHFHDTMSDSAVTKPFHDNVSKVVVTKPFHDTMSEATVTTSFHDIVNIPTANDEFPLPEDFPTASEERFPMLRKRDATAEEVCTANEDKEMEHSNPNLAKIPILDTGIFEQWKFRIQQYLQNEHYALWEVIEFGDSYEAPKDDVATGLVSEGSAKKKGRTVVVTTEDMQKRMNDVKARTTLLLALPDEHQLRFSKYKTAQELWAAILKTFGRDEATRKTKLQAIVSHLELMDVEIEQDDLNEKLLTSLTPEWLMHTIVWRNRSDLDTMSLDDLYNHLKVYEPEVQKKSDSQNMAFISSAKNISGNGEVNTASIPTASTQVSPASANVAAVSISLDTACAYIASQSNGSQIKYKDINQIDEDDIEEMDIKWGALTATKWATLLGSAGHPGAKTGVEEKTSNRVLSSDNEVFDSSLYFKACKKNTDSLNSKITDLSEKLSDSKSMLYHYKLGLSQVEARLFEFKNQEIKFYEKIRGLEFKVESKTNRIENLTNGLEMLKKEKEGLDSKLTCFQSASKDLDDLIGSQRSDNNKEGLGYNVVPPPAQVYSPPKKDMSWTGVPEFADDTITDYTRPSPSIKSNPNDLQN